MPHHFQWNPWHGCHKISEGCRNCFVYVMDGTRGIDSSIVHKSETMFDYPIQRCKNGTYKYKGHYLSTCFTSDFFIEEADKWRDDIWKMIKERSDVKFCLYTKRIDRVQQCLPSDWGTGYDNVYLVCTCENQQMADYRIPIMLNLPLKWRGIGVSPMLGHLDLDRYLRTSQIDEVLVCGESYSRESRVLHWDDVMSLRQQCIDCKVSFLFQETGDHLEMNGKVYNIPNKLAREQAKKAKIDKKFPKKDRINRQLTIRDL